MAAFSSTTELAFAEMLGLDGDPYQALLVLELCSDVELTEMLTASRVR